uniref:NADH-ubiquinone oxidoreductase chain 3 n=1 Tax=Echinolaelaps traubi TaxID=3119979 RepID=A0AAU6PB49_9ACAR
MIFLIVVILSLVLLLLSILISFKLNLDKEMILSFECGFDPFYMVRSSFSLHFFKICLIFVFFDIEIIIILLTPMFLYSSMNFMILYFFMLMVIYGGLIFEWMQGSIDWFF